jgi:hypothetical protein
VTIDAEYEQQIRRTIGARANARARWRAVKLAAKTKSSAIEWHDDWPTAWIPSDEDDASCQRSRSEATYLAPHFQCDDTNALGRGETVSSRNCLELVEVRRVRLFPT